MKRLSLFLVSILTTTLNAESIELKDGWNLIGLSSTTTVEKLKDDNQNIKKIYIYKGGFIESGEIKPADGVWIYSDKSVNITLNDTSLSKDEVLSESARVDKIELNSGWNLISLPINSAISPKVFKNVSVIWKYSGSKWNQYGGSDNSEYPKIDIIGSGEGFWINSTIEQSINLSDEEAKLTNFNSEVEMNEYLKAMVKYNNNYRGVKYYQLENGVAMPISASTPTPTPMPTIANQTSTSSTSGYVGVTTTTSTSGDTGFSSTSGSSSFDTTSVDGIASSTTNIPTTIGSIENATSTNLQEIGVDEADIVKHDGEKIFYLPSNWETTAIYVNTFERVLEGKSEKLTSIKLKYKPNELYLINDKLIAIYPTHYNFWESWKTIDYGIWSGISKIEVYDVADLENITKIDEYTMDGNIVNSRVTNNKLYLVTRFMPYIELEYQKIYVECKEYRTLDSNIRYTNSILVPDPSIPLPKITGENYCYYYFKDDKGYYKVDYDKALTTTEYLKPTITDMETNSSKEIPTASTLYSSVKFDQASFITSIISFDINDFSTQESVSVVGGSSTIYATNKALYVATEEYPIYYSWWDYQKRTSIYKFSIDGSLSYSGKTFVDGYILNQFSLSEYNDILRVASTIGLSWKNNTDNIVSIISETKNEEGENNLSVIGRLNGLGKDGEIIKGVRFIGDRGFVVTFRQTDPLYTIDLSDPINPKKVGELSITGYSSYFHPIDENRILSIGRDADENGRQKGVQIELFNITDFANPTLADKVTIGENWRISSEAEYNHKAFTYRESDNLFAIPINEYYEREAVIIGGEKYYPEYGWAYKNYLDIYQVEDMSIKKIDQVDGNATAQNIYNNQRGIIFTKDSKDYAIYIAEGEIFLKEIIK